MAYTNSPLVVYTKLSPNHSGQRNHAIDIITPHCVVGQCSVETLGNIFTPTSKQASSNYGIGFDGKVGMYVEEKNRSWCSSSRENDNRAVTIECASDTYHPYAMKDAVYQSLVKLCVDICKRNGKTKLLWLADKNKTMHYIPNSDEMLLSVHRWFANKACPGDWLYSRLGNLATEVTELLGGSSKPADKPTPTDEMYRVRKTWADTQSQIGAFTILDNAKKLADKNPGYFVFNKAGQSVYPEVVKPVAPSKPTTERKASDPAQKFDRSVAGSYRVTAKHELRVRSGAGTNKKCLGTLVGGTIVENYGYYSTCNGVKWLYVVGVSEGVKYTGFCSSEYLAKVR